MRYFLLLIGFFFSLTAFSQIDIGQAISNNYRTEKTPKYNAKGAVYAMDSAYYYKGADSASVSAFRRYHYKYDSLGKTLELIIQKFDTTHNAWINKDSVNYKYFSDGSLENSTTFTWDTVTKDWTDTISFYVLTQNGKLLKFFYRAWNMSSQSFYYGLKAEYQYNPAERVVLYVEQTLNNGDWINSNRVFYDYTADTILNYKIRQRWLNNQWLNQSRNTYLYNTMGKLLNKNTQSWDTTSSAWVNIQRETWIYLDDTLIIDYINQYWDDAASLFINNYRDSFYYSQNFDTTVKISMIWNTGVNTWIPTYNEWTFYQNSKMVKKLNQHYDTSAGVWINTVKYTFEYTGDNYSHVLKQNWDENINDWVNYSQDIYTYDNFWEKIKSKLTQLWNQTSNQWDTLYYTVYDYNSDGNLISNIYWSNVNGSLIPTHKVYNVFIPGTDYISEAWNYTYYSSDKWVYRKYYYTKFITALRKTTRKISIYPNPAKNFLRISGLNSFNAKAEIFDINGKILKTYSITGNTIDISNLPPGIYVLRITDGANIHTFKCVKQ